MPETKRTLEQIESEIEALEEEWAELASEIEGEEENG